MFLALAVCWAHYYSVFRYHCFYKIGAIILKTVCLSVCTCVCACMCSYACFLFLPHLKTWVHTCCYCAGNWFSLSESLVYPVLLFLKHSTLINHQFYYFNYSLVVWVGTRVLLCISGWPGTHSQLGDFKALSFSFLVVSWKFLFIKMNNLELDI